MRIMPFISYLLNFEELTKTGDGASDCIIVQKNASGTPPKPSPTELMRRRADGKRFPIEPHLGGNKPFIPSANAATGTTLTRATGE